MYRFKVELLKKHNIAIWRNHDHLHRHFPDGVKMGVITKLGWEKYFDPTVNYLVVIPAMTLKELIEHIKQKSGISTVRYIGDLSQPCKKILFNPGLRSSRKNPTSYWAVRYRNGKRQSTSRMRDQQANLFLWSSWAMLTVKSPDQNTWQTGCEKRCPVLGWLTFRREIHCRFFRFSELRMFKSVTPIFWGHS